MPFPVLRHPVGRARSWGSPLGVVAVLVLLAASSSPVPTATLVNGGEAVTQTVGLPPEVEAELDAGADVAPSQVDVAPFLLLGVSWAGDGVDGGQIRVRTPEGWDEWVELDFEDRATPGSGEDANPRAVSEPIWVGQADGYELDLPPGADEVQVHLVRDEGGASQAFALAATTSSPDAPPITSRSSWGARQPKATSEVASRLKMGFVHHTVSANDYTPADVPEMLRGIQAYHMDVNGWDDIGYNFLVDRAGQIWEGRSGGIARNVVGAHVGGFNTGSVGVAVIGDYRTAQPTSQSVGAVAQVLGWRLGLAGVDPTASTSMTGLDGQAVSLRTISGHRDAASTECPGQQLYDELDLVRTAAAEKASTVEPRPDAGVPPGIELACPADRVPVGRFSDIAGVHAEAIECLAWYGVTQGGAGGLPGDRYGPDQRVPRGQMATFVTRVIDEVDPGLLPGAEVDFSCPSDTGLAVAPDHPHADAIRRLAAAGVVCGGVGGRPADCFGPALEVTRGQMASFIDRALELTGVDLEAGGDAFDDDDGDPHEDAINAISAEGIALGTSATRFAPGEDVRRDQMASFLARTLNLLVDKDLASPPS